MPARTYGDAPYSVAVIHGGPGAAGEMSAVARELSGERGVLEPLQTACSVEAQIEELRDTLQAQASLPAILVGFSWGAWLSCLLAERNPQCVRKLILVSSGPFEERYAVRIMDTRLKRLDQRQRAEADELMVILNKGRAEDRNSAFARFGALFSRTDAFDPLPEEGTSVDFREDIFQSVWPQADRLRSSGELLRLAGRIKCPVVAIHGEHDPHPAEGVNKPLTAVVQDFRFIQLESCGHKPWIERQAREAFYYILKEELR
ncbi:MAG TPA: alpha/beta hydrolase [Candidatus Omnitrophota bacterium]|nr:alpha/beta hydrolase [Candidatus Omnitrophota bacterium]